MSILVSLNSRKSAEEHADIALIGRISLNLFLASFLLFSCRSSFPLHSRFFFLFPLLPFLRA